MNRLGLILSGVMVATSATAALHFLKFWRKTRDRFFAIFAGAFLLFSAHWFIRGFMQLRSESEPYFYLVRLGAFSLILFAIIDKNRKP